MTAEKYVCAFHGRRDGYQLPLSLVEANRLEVLITDFYAKRWLLPLASMLPVGFGEKMRSRREPGIPDRLVSCLFSMTVTEHVRHALGYPPVKTFEMFDAAISRAAAESAKRHRANLFLYQPYAWHAFQAIYPHDLKRILFQYHPHIATEERILMEDAARFPGIFPTMQSRFEAIGAGARHVRQRADDSWKMADHIVCASSFTRDSLIEAGANPTTITVVPYGVSAAEKSPTPSTATRFSALYVGSAFQRKGLHHLLAAWRKASLPSDAHLYLVCRVIDPRLESEIRSTNGASLLCGIDSEHLRKLYAESSLFVMPSLVEGFGHVYLEALSSGLPVLGTRQTCLPDLGGESDGIFLLETDELDELVATLEGLAKSQDRLSQLRHSAWLCARRHSWHRFRNSIREVI